jgi:hypothetical protein
LLFSGLKLKDGEFPDDVFAKEKLKGTFSDG